MHHLSFLGLCLVAFAFASTTRILVKVKTLLAIGIFLRFFLCFFKGLSTIWSFGWDPSICPLLYVHVPPSISSSHGENLKLSSKAIFFQTTTPKLKLFFSITMLLAFMVKGQVQL
jgi:hypothetical protein